MQCGGSGVVVVVVVGRWVGGLLVVMVVGVGGKGGWCW